jgi:hypothetical protein
LPFLLTILDGTNIFNAGHNFRLFDCVHFRANVLKPTIFAFLETLVILAISDQHCKFGFSTDNFHRHFSFFGNTKPHSPRGLVRFKQGFMFGVGSIELAADSG